MSDEIRTVHSDGMPTGGILAQTAHWHDRWAEETKKHAQTKLQLAVAQVQIDGMLGASLAHSRDHYAERCLALEEQLDLKKW